MSEDTGSAITNSNLKSRNLTSARWITPDTDGAAYTYNPLLDTNAAFDDQSLHAPTRKPLSPAPANHESVSLGTGSQSAYGIPQYRRKRLPWLDGSQSRKGSLPTAPGAYLDDPPNREDLPGAAGLPEHAPNIPNDTVDQVQPQVPQRLVPPVPALREPASAPMIETSRPALPLIALARELYLTDSSAALSDSETERSIRGGRRRALEDPTRAELHTHARGIPRSSIPVSTYGPRRKSRFVEDVLASPRAPATRRQTLVNPSSPIDRSGVAPTLERRPSSSLQPLRSKRVTIALDDLTPEARLNRNQSLSVQPLRSRGFSRSFQEDLTTDYVQGKRSRSALSESQAEKEYRKSIVGLEGLVHEAVQLAKNAAEDGRTHEVPAIMNNAKAALHRAATMSFDNRELAASAARKMEEQSSQSDSSRSTCSSESSGHSTRHVTGTKLAPKDTRPVFRDGYFAATNDGPTSDQASTIRSASPSGAQTVWDEDYPLHRIDQTARTDESKVADFAYLQAAKTVGVSVGLDQDKARGGLQNQQRPPPPTRLPTMNDPQRVAIPTAAAMREHVQENIQPPVPPRLSSLANQTGQGILEGTTSPNEMRPAEVVADAPISDPLPNPVLTSTVTRRSTTNWGRDKYDERDFGKTMDLRGKHHVTLKDNERFSIHHGHRRQPIARNWSTVRKRFVATVTCCNTALIGILIGIYAGEVPAIQYTLADLDHQVILGNVYLYVGMAITTFLFWPLPMLHGRKPYTLVALGVALPLQIPQAIIVQERRSSNQNYKGYISGLLLARGLLGLALGFAHINFKSTLLDLFGSSLQSEFPHGEVVITDDIRRHGGGMGYWLGVWSFSFLGSLSVGFLIGADVISGLNQAWGFYICTILIALALFMNVLTPETRRSAHRRTMQEVELPNDSVSRRVARGEVKMHVTGDGPRWWWEEVFAGLYLSIRMLLQSGFLLMTLYMGWIYAQIVLIIVLLGNLLSAEYRWRPEYVGLGVLSIGIGALLAVPNSKANFFSKSRINPPRTDSMTFQPKFAWTSHMVRRALFMSVLPIAGLAYTFASKGNKVQYMVPIVFAGLIGYVSNLAIAECNGIIMETFDTSDLQPGTNSRHRLQSLQASVKRKRTTYTSYPRVAAGLFTAQTTGFLFAAAATGVGGAITRRVGAQKATAITAGVLMGLTLLLICALVRFKVVQVIPNELFGQYFGSAEAERRKSAASMESDKSWRAVVIGNPSGKNRKMNWLELGSLSRWTEIRRLNRLLNRSTTQGLNSGWQ